MKKMQADYSGGGLTWDDVEQRVQAWIGHASQGDTWVLRERLLGQFAFGPGVQSKSPGRGIQQ
jgi:hypothetical protein